MTRTNKTRLRLPLGNREVIRLCRNIRDYSPALLMLDDLHWRAMLDSGDWAVRAAEVPFGLSRRGDFFRARLPENLPARLSTYALAPHADRDSTLGFDPEPD